MLRDLVSLIQKIYKTDEFVPLHEAYVPQPAISNVNVCMGSKKLSLGRWVGAFEQKICEITGAKYCIATSSGTTALTLALKILGIEPDDRVVTQSFTYVATANAIAHLNAHPSFVDIDRDTMGMGADSLESLGLTENVKAILPVNILGVNSNMRGISHIARENKIPVLVDACQSIMTSGFFSGDTTCLSFNGNKPVTTGGGGAILTNDADFEMEARLYLNQIGPVNRIWYNYRMGNINAAFGCGVLENFDHITTMKYETSEMYREFAQKHSLTMPTPTVPWLNAFLVENPKEVEAYLRSNYIEARTGFPMVHEMEPFSDITNERTSMEDTKYIHDHLIMLPSGVMS